MKTANNVILDIRHTNISSFDVPFIIDNGQREYEVENIYYDDKRQCIMCKTKPHKKEFEPRPFKDDDLDEKGV